MSEPSDDELNDAIKKMQDILNKPMNARQMRVIAKQDQQAASLRDMTDEERERVVEHLVYECGFDREKAMEFVQEMMKSE